MTANQQFHLASWLLTDQCQAIICDLDGLLIDSESWTFNAWIQACGQLGYDLPKEVAFSGVGKGRGPFKKMLVEYFGDDFDVEAATNFRTEIGNELLIKEGLKKRPGAGEFLLAVLRAKLPLGLASSTFREDALFRMKYGGIDPSIFGAITFGDQVKNLKPDPEIYLITAAKLGVNPSYVVAFEDSLSGVRAALAAGMKVVCIPDMEEYTPPVDPRLFLKTSLFECLTAP